MTENKKFTLSDNQIKTLQKALQSEMANTWDWVSGGNVPPSDQEYLKDLEKLYKDLYRQTQK